jgi:hypothetical protein
MGYLIAIVLFIGVFYLSGCFEWFLIDRCTNCQSKDDVTAICWMYEGFAPGPGLPNRFIWKGRIGVIHRHHLCDKCFTLMCRRMNPRLDALMGAD